MFPRVITSDAYTKMYQSSGGGRRGAARVWHHPRVSRLCAQPQLQHLSVCCFTKHVLQARPPSTRDFPDEQLLSLEHEDDTPGEHTQRLTPWQARHAALVVQSVKEINELRFVLCPRRMTDDRFWTVYFTLAKTHLPRAAYNRDTPVPTFAAPRGPLAAPLTVDTVAERLRTTFQGRLYRFCVSFLSFVYHTLPMHVMMLIVVMHVHHCYQCFSGLALPGMAAAAPPIDAPPADPEPTPPPAQRSMLEYDPDLEEYLKVAEAPLPGEASSAEDQGDDSDLDLDGYFTQLQQGAEEELGGEVEDEHDDDDVDDLDDALAEMLKSDEET